MSTPSLPDLPPNMSWLIHMDPTRDALDAYLAGHPPAGTYLGPHTKAFTITNVFTADPGLSRAARYSLLSAPSSTDALEVSSPGHRTLMTEAYSDDDIIFTIDFTHPHKFLDGTPTHLTEKDFPTTVGASVERVHREYQAHKEDIWAACQQVHALWLAALIRYGVSARPPQKLWRIPEYLEDAPCHNPLVLDPHGALPTVTLLDELCLGYCLGELLLLTARHELGYIYLRAKAWYDRAHERGFADPDDLFLDRETWELLSARAGGYRYWTTQAIADDALRTRRDAPVDAFEPVSDLARLYGEMGTWCKEVYAAVVSPRHCQRNGCPHTLLPHTGPGRPRKYCSDACDDQAQRVKNTEWVRTHRHKVLAQGQK